MTGCLIGNSSSTECLYETIGGGGDQTHIILLGRVGKSEYAKAPQIMQLIGFSTSELHSNFKVMVCI